MTSLASRGSVPRFTGVLVSTPRTALALWTGGSWQTVLLVITKFAGHRALGRGIASRGGNGSNIGS